MVRSYASQRRREERRRHRRGQVLAGCEVFSAGRHLGTYVVHELSAGGAALIGSEPLPAGKGLRLRLMLPGREALEIVARVVRAGAGTRASAARRSAVEFLELTAEQEDTIQQHVVAELEELHARQFATVLVLDQAQEIRERVERDFHELGREAIGVATPLEAIAWLTNSGAPFDTALVDLSSTAAPGIDLLDYLSAEHPRIRRVAIGEVNDMFRLDLAVRSGRAHALLRRPWSRDELLAVAAKDPAGRRQMAGRPEGADGSGR